MKRFKIAPDSTAHVIELAVLSAVAAGLTVIVNNVAALNLGAWSAIVTAGVTIALSVITNLENS